MALVAALALSGVASAAPVDPDGGALTALETGVERFRAGDLPAAREAFVRARDLAPSRANPYRWLALTEARLGHCLEAIIAAERFLALVPADDRRTAEALAVRDACRAQGGAGGPDAGSRPVAPVAAPVSDPPQMPTAEQARAVGLAPLTFGAPPPRATAPAPPPATPPPAVERSRSRWPIWVGIAAGVVAVGVAATVAGVLLAEPEPASLGKWKWEYQP